MDHSNHPIKFQWVEAYNDARIQDDYRISTTWNRFVELCSEHKVLTDKNEGKFIIPVTFKEIDETTDLHWSNQYVRRCADNVVDWYMLPVDIDGGTTIMETIKKFKDYEFILYTSWNHQLWKDGEPPCDRFRLFILLEEPTSNNDVYIRTDAIKEWIGVMDQTSLSRSRGFFEPSCTEEMYPESLYYHNNGKALDIFQFEPKKETIYKKGEYSSDIQDEMKQAVLDALTTIGNVDYNTWWKIGSAMAASDYDFSDFEYVTGYLRSHRTNACNAQWSSSKRTSIDFGYLVNLLKQKIGTEWIPKTTHNKKAYSEYDWKRISLYAELKQLKQK